MTTLADRHAASLVRDFLSAAELKSSLDTFNREYTAAGNVFIPLPPGSTSAGTPLTTEQVRANLLSHFDMGDRGQFFNLWDSFLTDNVRASEDAMRLEFYSSIHFAIYPINKHHVVSAGGSPSPTPLASTMDTFKAFLETRGAQLSQTTEFLPFYALPYLPDPTLHPSFSNLFVKKWSDDLRGRLDVFIRNHIHVHVPSRLAEVVSSMEECKAKEIRLIKKHQSMQADYHNLLAITSEVIGSLAAVLNGQQISQEYVTTVIERMQQFRRSQVDASEANSSFGPRYLNYDTIRQVLGNDMTVNGQTKSVMLHALRQRVLSQPTPQQQRMVVKAYIDYDLLGFRSNQPLISLLTHVHPAVKEQIAKLSNLMCSFHAGRAYFSQLHEPLFLKSVLAAVKTADRPSTQTQLLGVLEKMSLRRPAQTYLLQHGDILRYLTVTLLGGRDAATLTDTTITYAVALLLNLTLRPLGKIAASQEPVLSGLVKAAEALLEHADALVRSYVLGVWYSLANVAAVADCARASGVPELLVSLRDAEAAKVGSGRGSDIVVRQMDRVLERFASPIINPAELDDPDTAEDGDAEEEVEECDTGDEMDPAHELGTSGDEALGDQFLRQYEAPDSRSQGRQVPGRPSKPMSSSGGHGANVMAQLRQQVSSASRRGSSSPATPGPTGASASAAASTGWQGPVLHARPSSSLGRAVSLPPLARPPSTSMGSHGDTSSSRTQQFSSNPHSPHVIRAVKISQPGASSVSSSGHALGGMIGGGPSGGTSSPLPPPKFKDGHVAGSQELAEYSGAFSTRTKVPRTPPFV
ncbi:hypothetical protein BC828DRAFT_379215 [Blastocladiella britannica]|nr:hypothetical protein BC828DRAFT_379215 [Blastocladiella britannica]